MDFENFAIGIDIEEIERFNNKSLENDKNFLNRIFTKKELDYCFSKKIYAPSLCARFCTKEAVVKALAEFDIDNVYYGDIEILNKENGKPFLKIAKYPEIKAKISLSHTKNYACANVILYRE